MKFFVEEQRFRQIWLIIVLSFLTIVPIATITKNYLKEHTTITTKEILITIVILLFSIAIIFLFKLKTRIDEKGIHYQFFPLHFSVKTIYWHQISKAYVRSYKPISEFGGWGLRGGFFYNKGKEKAINVSGDIGIQLQLKNGEKLLIGTNNKENAKRVLETYSKELVKA